jgi:hypothetical protein
MIADNYSGLNVMVLRITVLETHVTAICSAN